MTVGMLLMTLTLVLLLTGLLDGAMMRLALPRKAVAGWMVAMLVAVMLPDVALAGVRLNLAGMAVTGIAAVMLLAHMMRRGARNRGFLPGSLISGAVGGLLLLLSDRTPDAALASALAVGTAACFLGGSRQGMVLCAMLGMLLTEAVGAVSGWVDGLLWTDAMVLAVVFAISLAEGIRAAAQIWIAPRVKGGEQG